MESSKHLSFLASKSMSTLRAESTDATTTLKSQRRAQRILPGLDNRGITSNSGGTTRDSIHSRWSSNASTVRETCAEDRAHRRASEYHFKSSNPKQGNDDDHEALRKSRRWTQANLEGDANAPPELPLLRISSFPDMMAAGLSICSPDATPASNSDSFTVSDNSSLSFQGMLGFASEFPQPPSLSPALRRMQSVPWLRDQRAAGSDMAPDPTSYSWRRMSHAIPDRSHDLDMLFPSSFSDLPTLAHENYDSTDILFQLEKALHEQKAVTLDQVERGSPLDRLREETKTAAGGDLAWARRAPYKTRAIDDLLQRSLSHQLQDPSQGQGHGASRDRSNSAASLVQLVRAPKRTDGRRNTVSSTPDASFVENHRTIRKVASMQSQAPGKPFPENSGQRPIPKIRSLRLFPPPASSASFAKQDHHETSTSKPRNWLFLRSSAGKLTSSKSETRFSSGAISGGASVASGKKVIAEGNRTPYPSSGHYNRASTLYESKASESTGRLSRLGSVANYESVVGAPKSSIGLGLERPPLVGKSYNLDRAFTLQKSASKSATPMGPTGEEQSDSGLGGGEPLERQGLAAGSGSKNNNTSVDTSTSFMDLTPEPVIKAVKPAVAVERKDRVRKFIAKASNGFLVWGRGLTAKKG